MKKRVYGKKLGRERDTRRALFRSLTASLVENGKIKTTKTKAKAIKPLVEKLVTLAKEKDQVSYRRVYALLGNDKKATKKLFEEIAPIFKDREGGYTRIIKLGRRRGDDAMEVRMEWVETFEKAKNKKIQSKKEVKKTKRESKK
jgi:large subunit ribosomal protein L17